jgi:hypothetical protein
MGERASALPSLLIERNSNMVKKFFAAFVALAALVVGAAPLHAQELSFRSLLAAGAVYTSASSGNVANASAVATIAAQAGLTNYVCGFTITGGGATAAALVSATLAGVIGGTMTFTFGAPAGATLAATPLVKSFPRCLPASGTNVAIVLTLPALGAGNTNAAVTLHGFVK